jgi:formylglycine-generating enzyme required for sulfatase activity
MTTRIWVVACLLLLAACSTVPPSAGPVSDHSAGETLRDCAKVCPQMVVVPPGRFQMGSPDSEKGRNDDEGPVHEVHIRYAFAVSKYPITRREWKQFVRETGHYDFSNCLIGFRQWSNHPAVCVPWQDAKDYAAWLSKTTGQHYRLLSEAEYEYVNRAGSQTVYFWGDSADEIPRYANMEGRGTTPVGSFKPNAFGLYDTAGNVQSWTLDCWHNNYDDAPTDGSAWTTGGDCSYPVVRGGHWFDNPGGLRSAARDGSFGSPGGGFRVARD